jgi:ribonuclease HI
MKSKLNIYSDGASRGNPGPSAVGFIALTEDGRILKKFSKYVGTKTNNQAEYEALISALEFASEKADQAVCHMDSELLVKQMNGEYRVKDAKLRGLWLKANQLTQCFSKITFVHVPRTDPHIQMVDELVNQTLNTVHKNQ